MTFDEVRDRLCRAKQISLIGLIKDLGYSLTETGSYYRMSSPFRSESQASFDINKRRPTHWADRGTGKHGDVCDFVKELFNLTHKEAVEYLLGKSTIQLPEYAPIKRDRKSIEIVKELPIISPCLIDYLTERQISLKTAQKWLMELEIVFPYGKTPNRVTKVLGFKSDSGGYEMRNKFLKVCNSPKDITTIRATNESNVWHIYEGFFSFLSDRLVNEPPFVCNHIVLNSLSFLPQVLAFLPKDSYIYSYLDNDTAGDKATQIIKEEFNMEDMRTLYAGYNDLNDWICGKQIKPKKGFLSDILKF